MKVIFFVAAMAAVVVARPQEPLASGIVPIIDYQLVRDELGQFDLRYVSGDGTKVSEQGALVPNAKGDGHVLVKQGSFSYYAPDGTPIKQTWSADAEGYHPKGDHLPVPPVAPSA